MVVRKGIAYLLVSAAVIAAMQLSCPSGIVIAPIMNVSLDGSGLSVRLDIRAHKLSDANALAGCRGGGKACIGLEVHPTLLCVTLAEEHPDELFIPKHQITSADRLFTELRCTIAQGPVDCLVSATSADLEPAVAAMGFNWLVPSEEGMELNPIGGLAIRALIPNHVPPYARICIDVFAVAQQETVRGCFDVQEKAGQDIKLSLKRAPAGRYVASGVLLVPGPGPASPPTQLRALVRREFVVLSAGDCVAASLEVMSGRTASASTHIFDYSMMTAHLPGCYEDWRKEGNAIPPLDEWLEVESGSRARFGLPAVSAAFGWGDEIFLSFVLERHLDYARFVELGTAAGVTSLLFGIPAVVRGGWFSTYDIEDAREPSILPAWNAAMEFTLCDLDSTPMRECARKAATQTGEADLLFVDGGHRLVEMKRYGSQLRCGGGMLVHDFWQVFPSDEVHSARWGRPTADSAIAQMAALGFAHVYQDVAEHTRTACAFFLRKGRGEVQDGAGECWRST